MSYVRDNKSYERHNKSYVRHNKSYESDTKSYVRHTKSYERDNMSYVRDTQNVAAALWFCILVFDHILNANNRQSTAQDLNALLGRIFTLSSIGLSLILNTFFNQYVYFINLLALYTRFYRR